MNNEQSSERIAELAKKINEEIDSYLKQVEIRDFERKERRKFFNYCMKCDSEFWKEEHIENKWLLWVDILNFSGMIEEEEYELVYEMLSFLSNFHHDIKPLALETSLTCSDTCVNIFDPKRTNLVSLIENIAILQINFLRTFRKVLRGALVLDSVFLSYVNRTIGNYNSHQLYFFGNGIIKANKLEKETFYPIISIDSSIILKLSKKARKTPMDCPKADEEVSIYFGNSNYSNTYKEIWNQLKGSIQSVNNILKEGKDIYFVDYLKILFGYYWHYFETEDAFLEFLRTHKEIIEEGNKSCPEEKCKSKYDFLKKYHNHFLRNLIPHIKDEKLKNSLDSLVVS
jgi:hypothetical protein